MKDGDVVVYADVSAARYPNEKKIKAWMESVGGDTHIPSDIEIMVTERDHLLAQILKLTEERAALVARLQETCHHPVHMLRLDHHYYEVDWDRTGHTTEHVKCMLCDLRLDTREESTWWGGA